MWLDDNKCKIKSNNIYLEIEEFKKICHNSNVEASNKLLEAYEKYGLLYPIYRINRPKEYLQKLFEQNHDPDRFKKVIEVSDEYGNLLRFEYEELDRWFYPILPGFDKALNHGHPLDQAYNRGESFIEKPSKETYRNWDEYNVVLQSTIEKSAIEDRKLTSRHFYSPWQIYLLEEANRKHTRKINVLIPLGEGEQYILSEEPQKLALAEWEGHFTTLWEYRFKENLLFVKALEGVKGDILEGDNAKTFHNDCSKIAADIYPHHSYESWIEFLRALCALYFDYQKREKHRLSNCLKKDIRSVIDILMLGTGNTYGDIINDVGIYLDGTPYFHVPPLERIYPVYESYLKREAKSYFESVLDNYNNEVPGHLKLDKRAVDEIIDKAFDSGNETLLVSIIGINKEYFSPSYFGNEGIWSFIRSLAVAVESWVKVLANKTGFREAIVALASGDFDSCCAKLQKTCGKTNLNIGNYADLKQFLNAIPTIQFQRCGTDLSWMKPIIRAYLIRNYVAHHTKLDPELFGSALIELYKSLLFLIFYAWKVK